jgi:hypothetical protein
MSRVFAPGSRVDQSIISLKNILIGILIGVILLAASVIGFTIMIGQLEPTQISVNFSVAIGSQDASSQWEDYENGVYGYSLRHPDNIKIYDIEEVSSEVSASSSILLTNREYLPGNTLASIPEKSILLIINSSTAEETRGRSLQEIAGEIYQINKTVSKSISTLNSTQFHSLPAYSFDITKAISYSSLGKDYRFPNKIVRVVLFVDETGKLHELIYKPTSIVAQILATMNLKSN